MALTHNLLAIYHARLEREHGASHEAEDQRRAARTTALHLAQGRRSPDIANTDQGSQFTSEAYSEAVESVGAAVSMGGRGQWIDNRFIGRLWRSVKYEDVSLRDYLDGLDLGQWFAGYNESRPHQALNYAGSEDVYQNPEPHGARTMQ